MSFDAARAEEWLGRRGVTRVIAPYSSLGEFGLRSAEFERDPLGGAFPGDPRPDRDPGLDGDSAAQRHTAAAYAQEHTQ